MCLARMLADQVFTYMGNDAKVSHSLWRKAGEVLFLLKATAAATAAAAAAAALTDVYPSRRPCQLSSQHFFSE